MSKQKRSRRDIVPILCIVSQIIAIAVLALEIPVSAFVSRTPNHSSKIKYNIEISSTSRNHDSLKNEIKYLGSGPDAIVRPGVVLVAPEHEYDHFLMRSAVFVYAIGLDDNQDMVIRGVIIDHPTAFTVGEMSPNVVGSISNNLLFRGGNSGSDNAMLLHSAGGPNGSIQSGEMIGNSGIYEGGMAAAMDAVDAGQIDASRCKFFFNYMQFRELELDDLFSTVEDGDAWASLEIPIEYVLDSNLERGEMWSKLRNTVKKNREAL